MYLFIGLLLGSIIGIAVGLASFFIFYNSRLKKIKSADEKSKAIIAEAQIKAEQKIEAAGEKAKEIIREADIEIRGRRNEITQLEQKLEQRELTIDRRDNSVLHREELIEQKNNQLLEAQKALEQKERDLTTKEGAIIKEIERAAGMSQDEARAELLHIIEEKSTLEISTFLKTKEEELNMRSKELSQNIIGLAIQKYAHDVAIERTVSVVNLPNDELKGRIIGREGRNVKTIEQLTGVDLIIDDTPEIITVSCFDPIRREIARRSLETLIKDGRIQPGRIEEIVEKTKSELGEQMTKTGEEVIFELNITKISPEIIEALGRLQFRTSYGQNVLSHSREVAHLAGVMAAELGLNQQLARRAGLLHDIGKALDFEVEGSHVEIGARLAKKGQEHPVVINAIESHHGDVPATSIISVLVAAADALSSARPGARSDTLENYIQRIEKLEAIAKNYDGVSNAYAIQAGREIRVIVMPEKVDDLKMVKVASDIKNQIESDLTYPGQIKVTVIREVRSVDTAK